MVTGASTGIGEQLAYHYARFGAQIVITARREKVLQQVGLFWYYNIDILQLYFPTLFYSPSLNFYCLWSLIIKQVAEKCLSLGAQKALYISADMSSDSDPDKVVDFALEKLGGLDYLLLNHIGSSPFRMWQGDVEHTKWLMQVLQHLYLIFSLY